MYHSLCKYLCTIFTILLFAMFVPSMVEAATLQSEYLTFAENEDGTLTVIAYDRSKHESPYNLTIDQWYTIDDKIYTVSAIGDSVFKGYTFHSIFIGQGISIGNHSFENVIVNTYKQSNLQNENVSIAGDFLSDITIGDYAFANAEFHSLVSFGSFTSVGDYAFSGAHFDYLDFSIFQSICHIGNYAFFDTNLSFVISEPQYIQSIGDYAFFNSYVRSFTIYPALQTIGAHAFQEEYSMTFTIHSSTTDISHLLFEQIIWDNSYFYVHVNSPIITYLEEQYTTYTIAETGETILPKAKIGELFTFSSTGTYQDPSTGQMKPHQETFHLKVTGDDCANLVRVETNAPTVTFYYEYFLRNYSFTIETIEKNTFQDTHCPNLTDVNLLLTKISSIEEGAFTGCSSLQSVSLPGTIKTIAKDAFPNSNKLRVIIPSEITNIDNFNISNLTNVIFVIDKDSPLAKTLSKMKLTYQLGINGKTVYPRPKKGSTFTHQKLKYKVTGKSTVTFTKPTNRNTTKLSIPSSVSYKGYTFKVTKVNTKACYKLKKLKTISIGDNVTQIGDSAFANCSKLTSITFGKNVKTLGKKVLYNNKKLKKIKFKGTKLQSIGKQTFRNVPKKVNIIVPTSKVKKYSLLIKKAK